MKNLDLYTLLPLNISKYSNSSEACKLALRNTILLPFTYSTGEVIFFSHLYGWSLVCVLRWTFNAPFWLNAFSQTLHLYGLSPVCVLKCLLSSHFWMDAFSQTLHLYGLIFFLIPLNPFYSGLRVYNYI